MIEIDLERALVRIREHEKTVEHLLASAEAFQIVSEAWLRAGWDTKYVYSFSWMGRPIIQLPEDMIRIQEVIYQVRPDVIIETGVAHGGSLVFYASLLNAMGMGRVIGIDIEIRPHNRHAIERHEMSDRITLIEGSSIDEEVVARVRDNVRDTGRVLVMLDSSHTRDHVLAELRAYGPMVSIGSYIVAADGIMERLSGAPRSQPDWLWNNPRTAVEEFVREHHDFIVEEPPRPFNEGLIEKRVTYWPGAFVKRVR